MYPLSRVTRTGVLRAGDLSAQPEVRELLRVGRVLLGTVLERGQEGRLELAIGRQRLGLETQLALKPGEQYLMRVENQNGEILLRLLGGNESAPTPILDALRGVLGDARPVGELLRDLAQRLNAEIERPGAQLDNLRELLKVVQGQALKLDAGGEDLHELLRRSGLRFEASLLGSLVRGDAPEDLNLLRSNLKAQLLLVMTQLEGGDLKQAIGAALSGLEAEQLLNVARQAAGDPLIWSFPFPDLEGWTTAQLSMDAPERLDEDEAGGTQSQEDVTRIALGISFSQLGPIRAEFSLEPNVLRVNIFVTEESLADRIRGDFDELMGRLGDGRRSLQLSTAVRSLEEVERNTKPGDVSFLRGKHLLDLEG